MSAVSTGSGATPDNFPVGLRILVVDDDVICLAILKQMLSDCRFDVTTCCEAKAALSLLRESKESFDVIISDVHMPGMDGFKLLELVVLEIGLPVVMISADAGTSAVMRGITNGACDYLIKPVRMEELRNIWQHVLRKRKKENKEHLDSLEDTDHNRRDDGLDGSPKSHRKKREAIENEDVELDSDDPKKPRVVWSAELHQQFVSAVNQLGIDKAVPKKILQLMNVPGITRENVASHLQKYRLYLKRLSAVALQHGALPNSFFGAAVASVRAGLSSRLDFPALAVSSQVPAQNLSALEAELFSQPSSSLAVPSLNRSSLQSAPLQGPNLIPVERGITFSQPLMESQTNRSNRFPQLNIAGSTDNPGGLNSSHRAISVQPSCLFAPSQPPNRFQAADNPILLNQNSVVAPSRSLNSFPAGSNPAVMNQNPTVVPSQSPSSLQAEIAPVPSNKNTSFNNSSNILDYGLLSSEQNTVPLDIGQGLDENFSDLGVLNSSSIPGPTSSSVPPRADSNLPPLVPNIHNIQESGTVAGTSADQGPGESFGFLEKDDCIPDDFLVDDIVSPIDDLGQRNTSIDGEEAGEAEDLFEFLRQL